MSITFSPAIVNDDFLGFELYCLDCDENVLHPDYQSGLDAYPAFESRHKNLPCGAGYIGLTARYTERPSLNMANGNALEVLDVLGLCPDPDDPPYVGSIRPDDLIGRILVALGLCPDPELPGYTLGSPGSATLVVPARRAGYLHEKLTQLHQVAQSASSLGREVTWG